MAKSNYKCLNCARVGVELRTQRDLPKGWDDMRRFWAEHSKETGGCGWLSKTFKTSGALMVYLGERRDE